MLKVIEYKSGKIVILDQRKLPQQVRFVTCKNYREVVKAIRQMAIRGAPALGVTTAFGIALGGKNFKPRIRRIKEEKEIFFRKLNKIGKEFVAARPTAVNISWATLRMLSVARNHKDRSVREIQSLLTKEAKTIYAENLDSERKIAWEGLKIIKRGNTILTHCNTGTLATAGEGTALGVIKNAYRKGKKIKVFVDETRPRLQGARLTTWELKQSKIPFTLICDTMAGYFMRKGEVDLVLVGADRVAANGDVANKIGTYTLSVLARENRIPFYVVCPISTIDFTKKTGQEIVIENRSSREVSHLFNRRICPEEIAIANPAFDLTPARYITGIITERGIIRSPYRRNLRNLVTESHEKFFG